MCQCFQRSKRLYWTHGCSRCGMALTNPLSTDIAGLFFQNRFGDCISPHCINRAIERISRDYNAMESAAAEEEGREPVLLPHFTVHNLRHTFSTRFCHPRDYGARRHLNHNENVYSEATKEKKKESIFNLEGKIKIS